MSIIINGIKRVLNVLPSKGQPTDAMFAKSFLDLKDDYLPETDKRPEGFQVPNQRDTGFCVAFAAATAVEYVTGDRPSEQWLYLCADNDEFPETYGCFTGGGTSTKAVLDRMRKQGMLPAGKWQFEYPPQYYIGEYATACNRAKSWKIESYYNLGAGKSALINYKRFLSQNVNGIIIGGVMIDHAYAKGGIGVIKKWSSWKKLGGHELVIGGYKDNVFYYDGSWGPEHGDNGRVYVSDDYIAKAQLDAYGIIVKQEQ